jgi:predicted nuclease with TOPRIM domain
MRGAYMSKELDKIREDLQDIAIMGTKIQEQTTGLQVWLKDVHEQLKSLTEQVKYTNGKVTKHDEKFKLMDQAEKLTKDFEDKLKLLQKCESGEPLKITEKIDKLELLPARVRYPLLLVVAIILLKVLDKGGDIFLQVVFEIIKKHGGA